MSTHVPRRAFNAQVTRFWGSVAKAYDWDPLQRHVYQGAQNEVMALLKESGSHKILDVACGTGILADRIQRELEPVEVHGVDMSDGMLAMARALSAKVRWHVAPAEQLPFEDDDLDAVVTTSAFHFFDQPAAVREFYRVLRPGGIAAVTTISPRQPITPQLQRLVPSWLAPSQFPTPNRMRELFEQAGFTIAVQRRVRRPAWATLIIPDLFTVGVKG